jgi:hypothetical protein
MIAAESNMAIYRFYILNEKISARLRRCLIASVFTTS